MTDTQWAEWSLRLFGPPFTLLVVFVVGLMRKWWVLGWTHLESIDGMQRRLDAKDKEIDRWQSTALRLMGHTDRAIDLAASSSREIR